MAKTKFKVKTETEESLGPLIRKRRKRLGLTLQALCDAADLSVGYLSQVERGNATPTLGTLAQLSQALDVPMEYFITVPKTADSLSRAENRSKFSIDDSQFSYETLSANLPGAELSSYILHVPSGFESETAKHEGEEIIYILEGEMIQTLGQENFTMRKGDSLHYNGSTPHSWCNPTDKTTLVLWTGTLEVLKSRTAKLQTSAPYFIPRGEK